MKLSEFEERLANVSGEKLLRMLEKARREGPEVAFQMIQAEAARRGLEAPAFDSGRAAAGGEAALEGSVPAPNWAEEEVPAAAAQDAAALSAGAPADPSAPVPSWLSEEQSRGLHPMVWVVLILAALAGAAALYLKFFRP